MKEELDQLREQITTVQAECTRLLMENRRLKEGGLAAAIESVREFHEKFGVPVHEKPTTSDLRRRNLRADLIDEEARETIAAIDREYITEIADGLADTIYVCIGAALEFGIPLAQVFAEVHRTNMLKVNGGSDARGKIIKPEGWKAPDIAAIMERASR